MRVLVVGSGGREHALAWKLAAGSRVAGVWIAPGNAGTAQVGVNLPGVAVTDPTAIVAAARRERIDLAVIGPEDALAAGVADRLRAAGVAVVGPSAAATRLETSKAFCKAFLQRHGIPTAAAHRLDHPGDLDAYLRANPDAGTIVLKMDGLAQGKGVLVAADRAQLLSFGRSALARGPVLAEEYLEGYEVSLFVLIDGERAVTLPLCSDYKQAYDGASGPNTGGMGSVCPVPWVDAALAAQIDAEVTQPTVRGLRREGLAYRGVLYIGLMVSADGPRVLEFNVRFGDPETQVLLPLLPADLAELLEAVATGTLHRVDDALDRPTRHGVTVVVAAAGYPGTYENGLTVEALPPAESAAGVTFHAATTRHSDVLRTGGGRSFAVTGVGDDLAAARANAYALVEQVRFPGAWSRTDIGRQFLAASPSGVPRIS